MTMHVQQRRRTWVLEVILMRTVTRVKGRWRWSCHCPGKAGSRRRELGQMLPLWPLMDAVVVGSKACHILPSSRKICGRGRPASEGGGWM